MPVLLVACGAGRGRLALLDWNAGWSVVRSVGRSVGLTGVPVSPPVISTGRCASASHQRLSLPFCVCAPASLSRPRLSNSVRIVASARACYPVSWWGGAAPLCACDSIPMHSSERALRTFVLGSVRDLHERRIDLLLQLIIIVLHLLRIRQASQASNIEACSQPAVDVAVTQLGRGFYPFPLERILNNGTLLRTWYASDRKLALCSFS